LRHAAGTLESAADRDPVAASSKEGSMKFNLRAFLEFKQLIVPPLMMVVYVIGFIGITLVALAAINTNALAAVLIWFFGQIYFRFILEIFMVLFRINDTLTEINERGQKL
jgi:hypothetical protein